MKKEAGSTNLLDGVWKFFGSVKLTVVLLLSIAGTSIVGTIIPQNQSPAAYFRAYGEFFYKIFNVLDIFDMYHSWWFQFLIIMLTINVVVCSIHRFSATWKIVFVKNPPFNLSRFKKLPDMEEFAVKRTPEDLEKTYQSFISKRFGMTKVEPTDKGFCIFAEK